MPTTAPTTAPTSAFSPLYDGVVFDLDACDYASRSKMTGSSDPTHEKCDEKCHELESCIGYNYKPTGYRCYFFTEECTSFIAGDLSDTTFEGGYGYTN